MFHKFIIGISKFIFALFVTTLVGYSVAIFAMTFLTDYIDTAGIDTFSEQLDALIQWIFSFI